MADHKVYAENGRTVIQKVGEPNQRIVTVDSEIDTVNFSVYMKHTNTSESWVMKFDEVLDKAGAQVDPTGTDLEAITNHVTEATAFSSAPENGALYVERSISSAELLAMATTPPEILPAPGAGMYYSPVKVILEFTYGTVAYSDFNNDNYFLTFLGLDDIPNAILVAPNSRILELVSPGFLAVASGRINKAVELKTDDPAPGYPNTGDGTLIVKLWYTIETF